MPRCRNTRPTNAMGNFDGGESRQQCLFASVGPHLLHLRLQWCWTAGCKEGLHHHRKAQSIQVRPSSYTLPSSLTPSSTHQRVSGYPSPMAYALALATARQFRPLHIVPPIPRRHPHRAAEAQAHQQRIYRPRSRTHPAPAQRVHPLPFLRRGRVENANTNAVPRSAVHGAAGCAISRGGPHVAG